MSYYLDGWLRAEDSALATQSSARITEWRHTSCAGVVPALPLSYSPVVGEIGVEPITWRISGVYAHAVGVRRHSMVDPAGLEPAASAMPSRCAPGCATGPCAGMGACESCGQRSPLREHTRIRTWRRHVYGVLLYPMSYVYAHAVRAHPIHWSRSPASNRQPPVYKTDARPLVLERRFDLTCRIYHGSLWLSRVQFGLIRAFLVFSIPLQHNMDGHGQARPSTSHCRLPADDGDSW